jgi:hypothetical protein
MKLVYSTLGGLAASAAIDDDAVLLSTSSVRSALGSESMSSLVDFAQEGSPRKAQKLLQTFAKNTLSRGEAVDDVTKEKLKDIAAQLTNNTWMALEQSHRRDQDLLNKHWRAIRECGDKHIAHLQQDVDSLEVALVRTHESDMMKCRGLANHTNYAHMQNLMQVPEEYWKEGGLKDGVEYKATDLYGDGYGGLSHEDFEAKYGMTKPQFDKEYSPYQGVWKVERDPETGKMNGQRYFAHASKQYEDVNNKHFESLLAKKNRVCDVCGELDAFLSGLGASKPNCEPTLVATVIEPKCTTEDKPLIETDLDQWFNNLVTFAEANLEKWQGLKAACDAARSDYEWKDEYCDEEQQQYETSFCAYRQGLHSTCAEYQGCHILTEEQFLALIQDSLYAADSRKIDWKAIHKIACYIKVLVSDGTNVQRTLALDNCESGDLNTLATILMGFNETNYLSLIIPEISGNVSCWDLDVPPLIDFKECDMSSVHQYPCTETWMDRYEGLESPGECTACATLPEHMMYSDKEYQGSTHAKLKDYGGGWIFVNELGRSSEDIDDLSEIHPEGYLLPKYNMKGLRWNEVLIQRTTANWCDSWGRQSSKWVEEDGASMCVQSDEQNVHCMSNHEDKHSWRVQPTSHFAALCGREGQPECECWPYAEGLNQVCFAAHPDNKPAPRHVTIHSLEEDGSVVKVSYRGEEKTSVLRVGNYGAFLDGVGCGAVTPVSYRVYVRCLGCTTERSDFHSKDGAQFNQAMTVSVLGKAKRAEYTYEAWFKSPLVGHFRRELFGGNEAGLVLVSENKVPCQRYGDGANEQTKYQLHVGNSNVYSSTCFQKNMFYHVAATRSAKHGTHLWVNGHQVSAIPDGDLTNHESHLLSSFGGGFTDGGQLFNVRIWDYAREKVDLLEYAAVTSSDHLETAGLAHWWPLTGDVHDLMTGATLKGTDVRYAPIWCSDLEATGMRVC